MLVGAVEKEAKGAHASCPGKVVACLLWKEREWREGGRGAVRDDGSWTFGTFYQNIRIDGVPLWIYWSLLVPVHRLEGIRNPK